MSQLQVTGEAKIRDIQGPVVANSGVITALDGAASQYVRGDGTLADFPTSSGGGSSVSYYLNSSVSQGTIGGVAYRELSKDPIIGAGTDIAISSNGYVANYITDVNDPDVTIVPGGNFNCEFYFSVSNDTGNPTTYAELYKYDGTTFTLLGTSAGVPEYINQGTIIAPYYFAIPVPTSALALTDRLAIRIYVNVDGRTVTLHTENGHLCQVVTTLSKGMVSLNNLTDQSQFITTGTSGTNFAIVSSGDTHTFNLPVASATNTGKLSSTDWSTFNGKVPYTGATSNVDLGTYSIGANTFLALGNGTSGGAISFTQTGTLAGISTGVASIGSVTAGQLSFYYGNNLFASILSNTSLTASRTFTLPDITGTLALLEGSQTFSGNKTFSALTAFTFLNGTRMDYGLYLSKGSVPSAFSGSTTNIYSDATTNNIVIRDNSSIAKLDFNNSTQTYTFPASSGTIALTSNLSSYVPYTGATSTVNLGTNVIYSASAFIEGTGAFNGSLNIKQYVTPLTTGAGYTCLFAGTSSLGMTFGTSNAAFFDGSTISANRTYTLPNASGTLALTSNLSSYVPYSGATTSVDLGSNSLSAGISISINGTTNGGYLGFKQFASATNGLTGYTSIYALSTDTLGIQYSQGGGVIKGVYLSSSLISNNAIRTYNFPNADGTIALTSNLSAYLPLTGGTLTGNLTIAKADTLNVLTLSSTNSNVISFTTSAVNKGEISVNSANFQFNSYTSNGYIFKNSTNVNVLAITDAGAATFSSSVTAVSVTAGSTSSTNTVLNANQLAAFNVTTPSTLYFNFTGGDIDFAGSKVIVKANGNVGIGTTNPLTPFVVSNAGGIGMETLVTVLPDASAGSYIQTYNRATSAFVTMGFNASEYRWFNSNTERMRITSGGNVGIGTTTPATFKLSVVGDGNVVAISSSNNSLSLALGYQGTMHGYLGGISSRLEGYSNNGGYVYLSSGSAWIPASDVKRKRNFETYNLGLDAILGLKPKRYNMDFQEDGDEKQVGLVAQEVKECIPQAFEQSEEFIGINYNVIIVTLVNAIQELKAEIDELKNK
jgi:hypothetical protein